MPHTFRQDSTSGAGFRFTSIADDTSRPRSVAEFTCVRCGEKLYLSNPGNWPPEFFAKKARQKGWEAHVTKASRCICTKCLGYPNSPLVVEIDARSDDLLGYTSRRTIAKTFTDDVMELMQEPEEKPLTPVMRLEVRAPPPAPTPKPKPVRQPKPREEGKPPMAIMQPVPPALPAPAPPASVRPPTDDEKRGMRRLLDAQFDDQTGCYIDGASDETIAQELNVPWRMVEAFREAAYGKLREDPELVRLKVEVATLRNKLEDLDTKITAYLAKKANGHAK